MKIGAGLERSDGVFGFFKQNSAPIRGKLIKYWQTGRRNRFLGSVPHHSESWDICVATR
jgi:hypothetical protein